LAQLWTGTNKHQPMLYRARRPKVGKCFLFALVTGTGFWDLNSGFCGSGLAVKPHLRQSPCRSASLFLSLFVLWKNHGWFGWQVGGYTCIHTYTYTLCHKSHNFCMKLSCVLAWLVFIAASRRDSLLLLYFYIFMYI